MTKLEIYNIALAMNGKKTTKAEMTAEVKPTEVDACDNMYSLAIKSVLGECDWSFFVRPMNVYLDDDQPHGKWKHGYLIDRCEVYRIARVDAGNEPFQILGERFYTDEDEPSLWGITNDSFILETAPRDFCYLVGLYLGYLISTILSPSDVSIAQGALQAYSGQLSSAMKRECNNFNLNYLEDGDWSKRV